MQDKINVLFVDDERHILTALRALFRSQYEVFTANSGPEALDIVRREHIHVIVSDQRMPKMLGSQLLAQVKEISPHTMRLLLTGYSDMGSIMKSINEGEVFRFITKPWDNDDIQDIVRNAVQIALQTKDIGSAPSDRIDTGFAQPSQQADYPALLVLDQFKDTLDTINDLFQQERIILRADAIADALDLLKAHEVAVVITDIRIGEQDVTEFIKILKQEHPLLMTIILTVTMDSETAIDLINQGQIYRYLSKPVSRAVLRLSIKQAVQQYQRNKSKPWLLDRFKTAQIKPNGNLSLTTRIRDSIRNFRHRFIGRQRQSSESNTRSTP